MLGPEWKYHAIVEVNDWGEIQEWCEIYIGKFDKDWYKLGVDPGQYVDDGVFKTSWYFKKEIHVILFKLRWL